MTHPADTAIPERGTGTPPDQNDLRALLRQDYAAFLTLAEARAADCGDSPYLMIAGVLFAADLADTTSSDDGIWVVIDAGGVRFKRVPADWGLLASHTWSVAANTKTFGGSGTSALPPFAELLVDFDQVAASGAATARVALSTDGTTFGATYNIAAISGTPVDAIVEVSPAHLVRQRLRGGTGGDVLQAALGRIKAVQITQSAAVNFNAGTIRLWAK